MNADESMREVILKVFESRFKNVKQCPNEHSQCIVCALGRMASKEREKHLQEMSLEDLELIYTLTPCVEEFKPPDELSLETVFH